MTDHHTRRLERAAKQGDPVAAERLARERERAHAVAGWEAASAVERDLRATLELLERTVDTLGRRRAQGYERGQRTTWADAAQATQFRELAQRLSDAVHQEGKPSSP